jgi:O-antigen/teichoic acid export membrane protein
VDEHEGNEESWRKAHDEINEQARRQAAAEVAWWKQRMSAQQDEVIRQNNLIYGGLIGVGIVMVQPFLTAAPDELDLAARICVIAFAVAIPILAALILLNSQEMYRQRASRAVLVQVAPPAALASGFVCVVAGFWHITPAAGVAALGASVVAVFVHSAGYTRVEKDDARAASDADKGHGRPG